MKKLVASLLLCACSSSANGGTDTGNPNDGRGTTDAAGLCDQTSRALPLDEATPLGVSAADLFAWVGGTHRETLAWQDQALSFGPEHGRSEITLEIEPLGARFIDRSPAKQASGGAGLIEIATVGTVGDPCADSIALDVRLHLSTAGGALDETLETTLQARASDFASGQLSLPIDRLTGSFTAEPVVPAGSVARGAPKLNVELGFSKYGDRGQLLLSSEFQSSDGTAVGQGAAGIVARFPADDSCESGRIGVAATESVRGVSVSAVLQALNGVSPARLAGADATLELAFQSGAERVCVALDGPDSGPLELQFPGRVQLHSSDQRINGSIDVMLTGAAAGGVLQKSSASANAFLLDRAQASAAVTEYAIAQPLDFSSYDGGSFEFVDEVSAVGATGALRANGVRLPDCSTAPSSDPGGGQSVPGCAGADLIPLFQATW